MTIENHYGLVLYMIFGYIHVYICRFTLQTALQVRSSVGSVHRRVAAINTRE